MKDDITANSLSEYFEISNSVQDTDNISPGDIYFNIESPFEITVSENIPTGIYDFELAISSNDTEYASYEVKDTISLEVNGNLFAEVIVPDNFTVSDAYPNPFNPSCTLKWETPQGGDLLIEVYDLNGSKLTTLVDSYYLAGCPDGGNLISIDPNNHTFDPHIGCTSNQVDDCGACDGDGVDCRGTCNPISPLTLDNNCDFEFGPLQQIASEKQLKAYKHNGFWQCMDNIREKNYLDEQIRANNAPWMKWGI